MKKQILIGIVILGAIAYFATTKVGATEPAIVEEPVVSEAEAEGEALEPAEPIEEEIVSTEYFFDVPLDEDLQRYIGNLCTEYDVPMALVMAIIEQESNFNPNCISSTGDYGLMQINKCNHKWLKDTLGVTDIMNPYDNAMCGVYMIGNLIKAWDGNINNALLAYNCGSAGAKRKLACGVTSTKYTTSVMAKYEKYFLEGCGND